MRNGANLIIITAILVTVGGPLFLAGHGLFRRLAAPRAPQGDWAGIEWRLLVSSTLLYILAFNVLFFVQELFLVLPKALTPNLSATLFHNNHAWTGENPLARLFQGTGAAVLLLIGLAALWQLAKRPPKTVGWRLFLIWTAYQGLFQSLPQVVVGAFFPQNDVGMAMDYLGWRLLTMQLVALLALGGIVMAGGRLTRSLLELADTSVCSRTPGKRSLFVFQVATLPALLSILLIIPFRVPGPLVEVVIVPVAVAWIGTSWLQASAWRVSPPAASAATGTPPVLLPFAALVALLLFFQLILRPGITF